MRIRQFGRFLDVFDQVGPGRGKALIRLGACTTFHQRLHHAGSGDLLAPSIEDLLLQLRDQGIGLVTQLNRELRHRTTDVYLLCSIQVSRQPLVQGWVEAFSHDR